MLDLISSVGLPLLVVRVFRANGRGARGAGDRSRAQPCPTSPMVTTFGAFDAAGVARAEGMRFHHFGQAVKTYPFAKTIVWQTNPLLASCSCGGESDESPGLNVSERVLPRDAVHFAATFS